MKDVNILTSNGVDVKKSLELFGDMNTYDSMMEDFLKEVDGKIASARRYKDTLDMANYAIIVHSLKSDCRYFGMEGLADMFYEHELAGKRNDSYFVRENFDKLMTEATRMINVVKRYMGVLVEEVPTAPTQQFSQVQEECVLVVDDSNIIRNFIEKIFAGKYKILSAKDGQEAISFIDNTPHDKVMCMFLDLNMPGVDGFQVLEHFKGADLFKIIPVSIITGSDDMETIQRAFKYPIVDMIQKPFNESKIRDVAEKTISRKTNSI
ncbi:MAG TPA: hypothetical protein DCY94_04345 [Firmicutes bacterium]|nr:hypothetical protein [Bacillota bacterium]